MAEIHITVTGGHFAAGSALQERLGPLLRPRVQRAALIVQGAIQRRTPVRTGTLRRSWTVSSPAWDGAVLRSDVGTAIVYAHYQDTATRNKGFIEAGIDDAKAQAVQEIQIGLHEAARAGWVKE